MAIHPSILAWRIPWTEEPGELQSIGSQRVWHNWSDIAHTHAEGFRGRGSISVPPQHWPASSRKPTVTGSCQACVPLHVECFVQMGENSSAASRRVCCRHSAGCRPVSLFSPGEIPACVWTAPDWGAFTLSPEPRGDHCTCVCRRSS